jgi:hypothetical protein
MNSNLNQVWIIIRGYINNFLKNKNISFQELSSNLDLYNLNIVNDIIILVKLYFNKREIIIDKKDKFSIILQYGFETFNPKSVDDELLISVFSSIILSEIY